MSKIEIISKSDFIISFATILEENIDIKIAASELLQALPEMENSNISELPGQDIVDFANKQTYENLHDLINIPESATKLSSEQIKEAFESALEKVGDNNWKIVIDEKTTKICTKCVKTKNKVKK